MGHLEFRKHPKTLASSFDLGYPTSAALNDSEAPASSATKLWAPADSRDFGTWLKVGNILRI